MASEPSATTISPLAGKPAPKEMLIDVARLETEYFERRPDLHDPNQLVSFGTSGHRSSPLHGTFTEAHIILAITQAICDYRRGQGTDGPLYMGKDTHALSGPARRTALEVLAANNVETIIQENGGVTPTPEISRAILGRDYCAHRQGSRGALSRANGGVRYPVLQPHRRARHARAEITFAEALARRSQGIGSGGRAHHCQTGQGSGEPCPHRRLESRVNQWLVCGSALRHGEDL